MTDDLYEVLGVLPSAEDVVITAAYRVLAQRYHPDRWQGSPAEAHERMTAINRAYDTLKDPQRRAAYDSQRAARSQADYSSQQDEGREAVFSEAISELETRWSIAAEVFPDLIELRRTLAKLSASLAFSYVTLILETKVYNERVALANRLQDLYLERYFGTNPTIKSTALELVLSGQRAAAKTLNELVDVLGSTVDPNRLIQVLNQKHGASIRQAKELSQRQAAIARYRRHFLDGPHLSNLFPLCEAAGYRVSQKGQGITRSPHYMVTPPGGLELTFTSKQDFIAWGKAEFK